MIRTCDTVRTMPPPAFPAPSRSMPPTCKTATLHMRQGSAWGLSMGPDGTEVIPCEKGSAWPGRAPPSGSRRPTDGTRITRRMPAEMCGKSYFVNSTSFPLRKGSFSPGRGFSFGVLRCDMIPLGVKNVKNCRRAAEKWTKRRSAQNAPNRPSDAVKYAQRKFFQKNFAKMRKKTLATPGCVW